MKFAAALGADSSNSSMSMSPTSVAMVARVMGGTPLRSVPSLDGDRRGSRVGDGDAGHDHGIRRELDALGLDDDLVRRLHAGRHRSDDLIGVVVAEGVG